MLTNTETDSLVLTVSFDSSTQFTSFGDVEEDSNVFTQLGTELSDVQAAGITLTE